MKSKVVEIKSVKDRTWPNGIIHFFTCKMENWDTINLGKKSADAIQLWSEINYDIVEWPNEYWVCKVKEVREEFKHNWGKTSFSKNYRADFVSYACSYAKDYLVSRPTLTMDKFAPVANEMLERMLKSYEAVKLLDNK